MKKESLRMLVRRGTLAALAAAAAVLTWTAMQEEDRAAQVLPTPAPTAREDRNVREEAYVRDLDALRQLMETADEPTAQQAARRVEQMTAEHQTELGIEEALHRAGYPSAFVLMQNGAITVFIKKTALTAEAGAAIVSLCTAHADVGADQIRLMTFDF